MIKDINIDNFIFKGYQIPTQNTSVLMIHGHNGFLACGYINLEIANKRNDVCALVTGVKSLEDMLEAKVFKLSNAALQAGIKEGMTGKEALLLMV